MKPAIKFVITALIIIAGAMTFQAYKSGAFDNVQTEKTPVEVPAATH